MKARDPFDLDRFIAAQDPIWPTVVDELTAGRKRTHWMWFVFPQQRGLGRSSTAHFYGIVSLDEARSYLAHRKLGPRLIDCTERVLAIENRSPREIFGSPDDMKFHSSMTLFALAAEKPDSVFGKALDRFWATRKDRETLKHLRR